MLLKLRLWEKLLPVLQRAEWIQSQKGNRTFSQGVIDAATGAISSHSARDVQCHRAKLACEPFLLHSHFQPHNIRSGGKNLNESPGVSQSTDTCLLSNVWLHGKTGARPGCNSTRTLNQNPHLPPPEELLGFTPWMEPNYWFDFFENEPSYFVSYVIYYYRLTYYFHQKDFF